MNEQNIFEPIAEHVQAIMNFMKEYYPNNFEFDITSGYANLRSTLSVVTFVPNNQTGEEVTDGTQESAEIVEEVEKVEE